jgi:glycosyltransferase involved in cell wall biosynthesis
MISVLIPTLNEARNISECVASVRWADEIVVVDSGSTDGTLDAARRGGARIVEFTWNGRLPKKKNWALENVEWKNEWVLILDADERVSAGLAEEIQEAVRNTGVAGTLSIEGLCSWGGG